VIYEGGMMKIKKVYVVIEDQRGDEFLCPVHSNDIRRIVEAYMRSAANQRPQRKRAINQKVRVSK
jgi:hypothetical protein